eukprot:CAMPEP_0175096972 /NCGR_PEP_ID=MMETSP0086_2-20121207/5027_1 /TAXON_ID=136419 /ORGANISM="Unknown Unknown, Strain D1" /LENGTH=44 /DNA_ID= /DNA_START= /DNA_END= /DNA_ORIENTATION=
MSGLCVPEDGPNMSSLANWNNRLCSPCFRSYPVAMQPSTALVSF